MLHHEKFTSFTSTGSLDPAEMKPELFMPFVECEWLPDNVNKFFRFGVPPLPEFDKVAGEDNTPPDTVSTSNSSSEEEKIDLKTTLV